MRGATVWLRVAALARRWLCGTVLALSIARSCLLRPRRRWTALGRASAARLPLMGQPLVDPAVELRGQPREHVLQIGPRLMAVEPSRLQEAPSITLDVCLELSGPERDVRCRLGGEQAGSRTYPL